MFHSQFLPEVVPHSYSRKTVGVKHRVFTFKRFHPFHATHLGNKGRNRKSCKSEFQIRLPAASAVTWAQLALVPLSLARKNPHSIDRAICSWRSLPSKSPLGFRMRSHAVKGPKLGSSMYRRSQVGLCLPFVASDSFKVARIVTPRILSSGLPVS